MKHVQSFLLTAFVAFGLLFVYLLVRAPSLENQNRYNPVAEMKGYATSMQIYAGDNNETFALWLTALDPYVKRKLSMPMSINAAVRGARVSAVADPSRTVLLYRGANERVFDWRVVFTVDGQLKGHPGGRTSSLGTLWELG